MADSSDVAIRVDGVYKDFKLPHQRKTSIKSIFTGLFDGGRGKNIEVQHALKDISFEVKKGEFFGIVGRNGSGKSTLLKILADIYQPTKGSVQTSGKMVPFIELGVGFNPELTGRENVYLNGALLGFDSKKIDNMYDSIVEFAELEKFMDQKLKNYSSGMQVRLAFSMAVRADADILLIDEVLAVGDEAFQRKCFEYFALLKREKKTVILVSHSMESIQRFCTKAMMLDNSNILLIGNSIDIAEKYRELNEPVELRSKKSREKKKSKDQEQISTELISEDGRITTIVTGKDSYIQFNNTITSNETIKETFFGFTVRKQSGELVYWYTTESPNEVIKVFPKNKPTTVKIKIKNIFGEGAYTVGLYLRSNDRTLDYAIIADAMEFKVVNRGINGSMLHPEVSISINQNQSSN